MKKIGIVTINDNNNYGNRLQNYAVQEILKKLGLNPITIKNDARTNNKDSLFKLLLKLLKNKIVNIKKYIYDMKNKRLKRRKCFKVFNKNIKYTKRLCIPNERLGMKYDYYVAGSDQIWKPTYDRMRDMDLLNFTENRKKIAFSASIGISQFPENKKKLLKNRVEKFKMISLRENEGKKIVEDLTGRNDIEVLIDPTMMLDSEEWDKVAKKPNQLNYKKYILNYFLGELSKERKEEINRIAKENDCDIINILDVNDPLFLTGPSEFLYLEKNAFLVCTDSFHSSVFSIIYDTPFIVFEREDSKVNMNSRIDTLLTKFNLLDRKFINRITDDLLKCNYSEAKSILNVERDKSIRFLKKAFEI